MKLNNVSWFQNNIFPSLRVIFLSFSKKYIDLLLSFLKAFLVKIFKIITTLQNKGSEKLLL